ncbi:serine/threonine protein kinase [candidate division CSSED10-310 bacterium]|uniref:Serine/threonine protein kinase n=1 Tax=candidate division CSSED10-310 bacterium TaxID=2855610 RepID=A0ABV6YXS4_UNCC1
MNTIKKINKYDVIEVIGQGGSATVYKALDPVIKRHVAIKLMIDPGFDTDTTRRRFFREAQTIGQLQHPYIITIFDAGEYDKLPYLVVEYLEGHDLRAVLKKENLPLPVLLTFIINICHALEYAHIRGIVHRDIKPSNIFVQRFGHVKLMDFGIAKRAGSHLTQSDKLLGTVHYMSPEQINEGSEVDFRTDIFSLGVILYEMFSKKLPFRGNSFAEIIPKILFNEPEPFEPIDPDIPQTFQDIIMKCLAKEKDERYQSVIELVKNLQNIKAIMGEEVIKDQGLELIAPDQPDEYRASIQEKTDSYHKELRPSRHDQKKDATSDQGHLKETMTDEHVLPVQTERPGFAKVEEPSFHEHDQVKNQHQNHSDSILKQTGDEVKDDQMAAGIPLQPDEADTQDDEPESQQQKWDRTNTLDKPKGKYTPLHVLIAVSGSILFVLIMFLLVIVLRSDPKVGDNGTSTTRKETEKTAESLEQHLDVMAEKWIQTITANRSDAYEEFVLEFKDKAYAREKIKEAYKKIEMLTAMEKLEREWEELLIRNEYDGFLSFINQHQDNIMAESYIQKARTFMKIKMHYQNALDKDTSTVYRKFITDYEKSVYAEQLVHNLKTKLLNKYDAYLTKIEEYLSDKRYQARLTPENMDRMKKYCQEIIKHHTADSYALDTVNRAHEVLVVLEAHP